MVQLPNIDDRRWSDLVEEGRSLVPVYSPEWTDHNVHDPGITLMELFAWITEMDIYQLNRVPAAHVRKFLALVGVAPHPPSGAKAVVSFRLSKNSEAVYLPKFLELDGETVTGTPILFRTVDELLVASGQLTVIQVFDGNRFVVVASSEINQLESFAPFGDDPHHGTAVYFGFASLDTSQPITLYFIVEDCPSLAAGPEESTRPEMCGDECGKTGRSCASHDDVFSVCDFMTCHQPTPDGTCSRHCGVELVWEFRASDNGRWHTLESHRVDDDTRGFTKTGKVTLDFGAVDVGGSPVGRVDHCLSYIRCRFNSGQYDAAPKIRSVLFNGVAVEQTIPVGPTVWKVAKFPNRQCVPRPQWLDSVKLTAEQTCLHFCGAELTLAAHEAPDCGDYFELTLDAINVGEGTGLPCQQIALPDAPVACSSLRLLTFENSYDGPVAWRQWINRPDFDSSGPSDSHFVVDAHSGFVQFGDGQHGRVVPDGATVLVTYLSTMGEIGNVPSGQIKNIADTRRNQIRVRRFCTVKKQIAVEHSTAALGGSDLESLDMASVRAIEKVHSTHRAVTLEDYEKLTLQTSCSCIARVKAAANQHPAFQCVTAPGVVTIVVVPYLPLERPSPSIELIEAVSQHLNQRRVLGTRVEVTGPEYIEVIVKSTIRACHNVDPSQLTERIRTAIDDFFHPLRGGPKPPGAVVGDGWPFGRDVYRSEVLQLIDETFGTDYVISLEFLDAFGNSSCDNVCIPAQALVASGQHQIEVLRADSP